MTSKAGKARRRLRPTDNAGALGYVEKAKSRSLLELLAFRAASLRDPPAGVGRGFRARLASCARSSAGTTASSTSPCSAAHAAPAAPRRPPPSRPPKLRPSCAGARASKTSCCAGSAGCSAPTASWARCRRRRPSSSRPAGPRCRPDGALIEYFLATRRGLRRGRCRPDSLEIRELASRRPLPRALPPAAVRARRAAFPGGPARPASTPGSTARSAEHLRALGDLLAGCRSCRCSPESSGWSWRRTRSSTTCPSTPWRLVPTRR